MQFGRSPITRCHNLQYRWTKVHLVSNHNAPRRQHCDLSILLSSAPRTTRIVYGKAVSLRCDITQKATFSSSASLTAGVDPSKKTWSTIKRPNFRPKSENVEHNLGSHRSSGGRPRSIPSPVQRTFPSVRRAQQSPDGEPLSEAQSHLKPLKPHYQIPRIQATVEALEEELQWMAQFEPNPTSIKKILTILIENKGVKPGPQHYDALILANCDPTEGSASNVHAILREMEDSDIEIGATTYAAALSALAVHPSITLVTSILSSLESRWIPLSSSMNHNLILCLIRTSQLELANDLLNDLHQANKPLPVVQRTPIPKYLYTLLITALVEKRDYEGVMRWIYRLHDRKSMEMDMAASFWGWVLEHASRDGDEWVTGWLWQDWAEKMRIRPTRETCLHILQIAARDGVPWLAESVRDTIEYGGCAEITITERIDREKGENQIKSSDKDLEQNTGNQRDTTNQPKYPWDLQLNNDTSQQVMSSNQPASDTLGESKAIKTVQAGTEIQQDPVNKLTTEEEALIDQAYASATNNLSQQGPGNSSRLGVNVVTIGDDDENLAQTIHTPAVDKKSTRVRQVKPGNLWPLFKTSDGRSFTRFDPWDALGPKSRT